MAKSKLFDANPLKRKQTVWHEEDGKTYLETRQNVDALVEAANALADEPPEPSTGLRFVGFIPDTVFNQACREGWVNDKARWRQWMLDRDNRKFNGGRENPF